MPKPGPEKIESSAPEKTEKNVSETDELVSPVPDSLEPETAPEENDGPSQIEQLRTDLEEANERFVRAHADLDNFRKRARREMEEHRRYANLPLLLDLLQVVENMNRALEAAKNSENTDNVSGLFESLFDGFKMVASELETVFERFHCSKIEALGQPFDPNLHEAISQRASTDHPAGTVIQILQVGYKLHDRVIRPSQVIISTGPPEAPEESAPDEFKKKIPRKQK